MKTNQTITIRGFLLRHSQHRAYRQGLTAKQAATALEQLGGKP
jgi:hypothetical protein